jgi:Flp pilus assembly protein TadB
MVGNESWQVAVAMFLTVTLSAVAVVMLLQWWGDFRRGRDIRRSLQSLAEPTQGQDPDSSIFRQARNYTRLDVLLSRLPRASDLTILLQQADSQLYLSTFIGLSLGLATAAALVAWVTSQSWLIAFML